MRIKQSVVIPAVKPAEMELAPFLKVVADIGFQGVETWSRGDEFRCR